MRLAERCGARGAGAGARARVGAGAGSRGAAGGTGTGDVGRTTPLRTPARRTDTGDTGDTDTADTADTADTGDTGDLGSSSVNKVSVSAVTSLASGPPAVNSVSTVRRWLQSVAVNYQASMRTEEVNAPSRARARCE